MIIGTKKRSRVNWQIKQPTIALKSTPNGVRIRSTTSMFSILIAAGVTFAWLVIQALTGNLTGHWSDCWDWHCRDCRSHVQLIDGCCELCGGKRLIKGWFVKVPSLLLAMALSVALVECGYWLCASAVWLR